MYVRLGQVPSIVQPANPTPLNDATLQPRPVQPHVIYHGYPVVSVPTVQPVPAAAAAPAPAASGSFTDWLQTGNNGIYVAIAAAVLLLLLTRRR